MTDMDIVDELRGFAGGSDSARATLMRDAADEIERLRDEGGWSVDRTRNSFTGERFERLVTPWEPVEDLEDVPVEGDTLARHAQDSHA